MNTKILTIVISLLILSMIIGFSLNIFNSIIHVVITLALAVITSLLANFIHQKAMENNNKPNKNKLPTKNVEIFKKKSFNEKKTKN